MNQRLKDYHFLCACLSPQIPSHIHHQLKDRIAKARVNWDYVLKEANHYLMIPALYSGLRTKNLLEPLDTTIKEYLFTFFQLNLERNTYLKSLLTTAIEALNKQDIVPILFKGGGAFYFDIFPDKGSRVMVDVDLIVKEEELDLASTALLDIGYHYDEALFKEYGKLANMYLPGKFSNSLELHTHLNKTRGHEFIPMAEVWRQAKLERVENLSFASLSVNHKMLYHIIHAEVQHEYYSVGAIELRQLHDFAFQVSHIKNKIVWPDIKQEMMKLEYSNVFHEYLYLARHLMFCDLPELEEKQMGWHGHYRKRVVYVSYPRLSAIYRLITGFFMNLSKERIQAEFQLRNEKKSINRFRWLHIKKLIKQYRNLDEIKDLWRYHSRF